MSARLTFRAGFVDGKIVTTHLRATGKELTLTLEINATADGFDTRTERIVKENVTQLGFESHEFET